MVTSNVDILMHFDQKQSFLFVSPLLNYGLGIIYFKYLGSINDNYTGQAPFR